MNFSSRESRAYGALEQWAGITRYQLLDGQERGVEIIEIRDGAGLRIGVCPARALDIVFAEWRGVNFTYRNPNGAIHPAFYGAQTNDWLRGAPNGLVTTCGLRSIGPPSADEGEHFGIHDRVAYLPAREVGARTLAGADGQTAWEVRGIVRQTRLFGANLKLERTIRVEAASGRVALRDVLTNEGFADEAAIVLYHCNFGYPLLEAGARVEIAGNQVEPRDADCDVENWADISAPQPNRPEEVFFHQMRANAAGLARAAVWNPMRKLGVSLSYSPAQLPFFTQWKSMGAGDYALGLEPSNAPLASRAQLRERGELPMLPAGASQIFELQWQFGDESV